MQTAFNSEVEFILYQVVYYCISELRIDRFTANSLGRVLRLIKHQSIHIHCTSMCGYKYFINNNYYYIKKRKRYIMYLKSHTAPFF